MRGLTERFFGGVKFSTPGFFGKENICKHFLGWLDFNKDFLCIQNNLKIRDCGDSGCVRVITAA